VWGGREPKKNRANEQQQNYKRQYNLTFGIKYEIRNLTPYSITLFILIY
jgi:hypothetical protein